MENRQHVIKGNITGSSYH